MQPRLRSISKIVPNSMPPKPGARFDGRRHRRISIGRNGTMNRRRQFFSTIGLGFLLAGGAAAAAREEFPTPGKPRRTFLPTAPARRPEYKVFTVPAVDSCF